MKKAHRKKIAEVPVGPVRKTGRAIYWLLGLVATLLGIYFARPKMVITPQATVINPAEAFLTPFDVANAGEILPMTDIKAGCDGTATYQVKGAGRVAPKISLGVDRWPNLDPGKSFTTTCNFALDVGGVPLEVSAITITMKTKYSVSAWPFRLDYQRSFRFVKGPDGQFHWLGNG